MKRFASGLEIFEGRLDRPYNRNSKGYFNHSATVYGRHTATCFQDLDLEFTSPSAIFRSIDLQAFSYKSTLGQATFKDSESFIKVDRDYAVKSPFVSFDKRSTESRLRKVDFISWLNDQYSTMRQMITPKKERPKVVYSRPVDLGLDHSKCYENTSRSFSRIMKSIERLKDRSDCDRLRLQKAYLTNLVTQYVDYFDRLRSDRLEKRLCSLYGNNHQEIFKSEIQKYEKRKKQGLVKVAEKIQKDKGIDTHIHYRQSVLKGQVKFEGYSPIRSLQVINLSQFSNLPLKQFDRETNQFIDFKEIVMSLHTTLIKTLVSTYYLPVKGFTEIESFCDLETKATICDKFEYSELRLQKIEVFTIGEFSIIRTYGREVGQMFYNEKVEVAPYCDLQSRKVITGRDSFVAPVCMITQPKEKKEKSVEEKREVALRMIKAKKDKAIDRITKSIKVKATTKRPKMKSGANRPKDQSKEIIFGTLKAIPSYPKESIDFITNSTITLEKSLSDSIAPVAP
jgi:hypothetical protein